MASYSFAKKFNKERLFNINTEGFDYCTLEELFNENGADTVYQVHGIYINNKSIFDPAPVIALADRYVNFPSFKAEECEEILHDPKAVIAINQGTVGFKIYSYEQKRYHKTCYSIEWLDVNPDDFIEDADRHWSDESEFE